MANNIKIIAEKHDPKCRVVIAYTEISKEKTIVVVEKPAVSFRQEFENDESGSKESLRVFIEKCDETC